MNLASLSAREQRTVGVGLGLVVLIIGAGRGLPALHDWRSQLLASAHTALRELDVAETDVVALQETLDTLQHRKKRFLDFTPKLVAAGPPATVSATMGSLLARIADANGVQIASVRTAADTGSAQIRRVSAAIEAFTDVTGLAGLLRAIESEQPLLNVAELSIEQTEPAAPNDHPESLHVSLRVQGLFLAAAPKASR